MNNLESLPQSEDVEAINRSTRSIIQQQIGALSSTGFEELVRELLQAIGFEETARVGQPNDKGVDVRGILKVDMVISVPVAVQVKHKPTVGRNEISTLRGDLTSGERGILVASGAFTRQAIDNAPGKNGQFPISLIDGERFITLLLKHKVGVQETRVYLPDTSFWSQRNAVPPASVISSREYIPFRLQFPLPIYTKLYGERIDAELLENYQVRVQDQIYKSPSAAGTAITKWKSCNGWRFWYFTHPETNTDYLIDQLRDS